MEKYSFKKAQEEAELMQKKVEDGDANNYNEAENLINKENDNNHEMLDTIHAKNPELADMLKQAYELVLKETSEFDERDYEDPEQFSITLHKVVKKTIEKASEEFGSDNNKFSDILEHKAFGVRKISDMAGMSQTYNIFAHYAERHIKDSDLKNRLSSYFLTASERELFIKNKIFMIIGDSEIFNEFDSADDLIISAIQGIPPEQREDVMNQIINHVDEFSRQYAEKARDGARTSSATKEIFGDLDKKQIASEVYHNVGTALSSCVSSLDRITKKCREKIDIRKSLIRQIKESRDELQEYKIDHTADEEVTAEELKEWEDAIVELEKSLELMDKKLIYKDIY